MNSKKFITLWCLKIKILHLTIALQSWITILHRKLMFHLSDMFSAKCKRWRGGTIDQFVCRLRQKAISCEFPSVNEAIRDQIIEKCRDPKLRRKFLEKSSEATLTVLQETARVHEAVNTQMQSMERPEQVNKLSPNDRQAKEKGTKGKKPEKERKCYRCGGTGRLTEDKTCPALDKTCNKCGKSGHFAACCKTKSTKKPSGRHRSEGASGRHRSEGANKRRERRGR